MARKLRMEEAGGVYHVINRGNYRQWIFREEGARDAFEATLFEACERAKWVLHGYCVMSNHYHLALETPQGNLSEGMRWLQSVFANRFNRYRKESGHLFHGRFKSLLVENRERLAWLCHYVHLNPVRAGMCPMADLPRYRWSSYWHLYHPKERPECLDLKACLAGSRRWEDTASGRRRYHDYLAWLNGDKPAQEEMAFSRMSHGWVIGSEGFRIDLVENEQTLREVVQLTQAEARSVREDRWAAALATGLRRLGRSNKDVAAEAKSADWKVALASDLKTRLMCTNGWLGRELNMGAAAAVCRYVSEAGQGKRPSVSAWQQRLNIKH